MKKVKRMQLTRRDFVKGGLTLGAITTTGGLAACSPPSPTTAEPSDEEAAVSDAIARTWETYPGDIDESRITETIETDVVVIGLGASGSYVAASAIENDLRVIVLERNDQFNANGGSHFVFNSKPQRDLNKEVDAAVAVKDFLNVCANKVSATNVWVWANRSGEAADWLAEMVEPYGLYPVLQHSDNEPITPMYPGTIMFIGGENEPVDVSDNDPYNGDLGLNFVPERDLLGVLLEHIESKGADVRFGQKSERIIKGDDGYITGVIASDANGNYTRYLASKGVVIASGGYDQDQDMHDYFCPTLSHNPNGAAVPLFNMGDGSGIKQALWVGGTMQANGDHPPMIFWGSTNCIKNLLVNKLGKRFSDENVTQSNMAAAQLNQPGGTIYGIWNEAYAEQLPAVSYRADDSSYTVSPEQMKSKWATLVEAGLFIQTESIDEIADKYGIPDDVLNATVEAYNGFCTNGVDEEFRKDPTTLHELTGPFYATEYQSVASLASMGGLHVNEKSQVLDANDKPIDGLYAIGLAAGDFYANQYTTRFAGNSLGRCLTFGYLLGRQIAGKEE
ncbi:MAG: FAD-binding protein [Coriobacteriales bacterium]|jgi:succinate dehydrogenase/fumarate reductase flavoprotein subunit|nr:FAD-binding protein [Coriobacteriales bacterium]